MALGLHALAPPTRRRGDGGRLRTAKQLPKVLARHPRLLEDGTVDPSTRTEQLAALVGAAGLGLAGERPGKPLLRVVDPAKARIAERVGESFGVNVHAEVAMPARDRARLARLCRSLMTQSISLEGAITRDAHGNITARVNPDGPLIENPPHSIEV